MSIHELPVGRTVEWYTPVGLFLLLGAEFDLDPIIGCWPGYITLYRISPGAHRETQILIQRSWMLLEGLIAAIQVPPRPPRL